MDVQWYITFHTSQNVLNQIQDRKDYHNSKDHNLILSSPIPAKEIATRVTDTKQQLTEVLRNDLIKNISTKSNKRTIKAEAEAP